MGLTTGKLDPTTNIPQINSKADAWISWHKTLVSNFGKKIANALWLKAWSKRGSSAANTSDLRSYMTSQGVTIDSGAWDKFVDLGSGITDFIGDSFKMGKYISIGLAVIVIGGLGIAVYNIARRPGETIGTAVKAAI